MKLTFSAGRASFLALSLSGVMLGCANRDLLAVGAGGAEATTRSLRSKVDTIVVIYAENRAFDNLYGDFPGAHGLSEVVDRDGRSVPAYVPQIDRDGSVLRPCRRPGAALPPRASSRW